MLSNNAYQPGFKNQAYTAGTYQNQFYQNQPSDMNSSKTVGRYYTPNPRMGYSLYRAAFAALPAELGGEIPRNRSQFSGVPNW